MEENKSTPLDQIVHFVYETSIHSKTPRSGLWFLGSGNQSVAEHLFHTALIAYALCHLEPKVDKHKVVLMALFHDLGEGRTSDLNYVHQRYGRLAEASAVADMAASVPFGDELAALFAEVQVKETLEAQLVKDADQLEWISLLRAEEAKGNMKATEWMKSALQRLKTEAGKALGERMLVIHPDAWWFNPSDNWFVERGEEDRQWKIT